MRKLLSFVLSLLFVFMTFSVISAAQNEVYELKDCLEETSENSNARSTWTIELTRSEVEARALAMANLEWTVQSNHKTGGTNITVPSYVRNASVGSTVTGIPYCWGGFNGLDTCGTKTKFSEAALLSTQTAGNVNCSTSGHVTGTIGLDCSGFVSSAYGFTSKKSSGTLPDYATRIGWEDLKPMDFLCAEGHHVVLYHSSYTDDKGKERINLYDCITTTYENIVVQKVSYRSELKSKIVDEHKYIPYTVWNPVCTYSYVAARGYHYRQCTDCGYKLANEAHEYSYVNGRYRCDVCGFTTSTSTEINSAENEEQS